MMMMMMMMMRGCWCDATDLMFEDVDFFFSTHDVDGTSLSTPTDSMQVEMSWRKKGGRVEG